jgi:hypothetical protein
MYHPNQNVYPYHHDYPYEPRTHTYASPAGMYYPASNTHPIPLGPDTLADLRQREGTSYPKYGQGRGGGLSTGRGYDTHNRYGPGDWVPADPRVGLGISTTGHAELIHSQIAPHTSYDFRRPDQLDPSRSIRTLQQVDGHMPTHHIHGPLPTLNLQAGHGPLPHFRLGHPKRYTIELSIGMTTLGLKVEWMDRLRRLWAE